MILIIFCSFAAVSRVCAAAPQEASIGEVFAGEELQYDIGFWIFSGIAEGRLVLKDEGDGRYVATLSAKSNGVLDTILKHRRDRYTATLRLSDDGRRFLTESFEKELTMDGKGTRRSLHKVDYSSRTVSMRSWGGGKPEKTSVDKIPAGVYTDDPLAAFYNFRYGVYGGIAEGRDYRIMTFPKEDKIPEIFIRIAPEKEFKRRNWKGVPSDLLADARIDKDLFGSSSGDIEIFFTKGMLPVQAIAKDLVMFGDVKGKLREVIPASGAKKTAKPLAITSGLSTSANP
ncbi:MAG: DUF3108 domain-containing protein [Deltaproteobacteria bacterium]|nr:DUF3108 domain-containing protein [Deltaproteobacteria bacterium]